MRAPLSLFAVLLFCQAAHADLFTAQLAYGKGEYEQAFKEYRDLAELGQSVAQCNLAIMYAQGQGVRQSDLNAYAWATLAAEGGYAKGQTLADQLRPLLAPGSEQMAEEIAAPYRHAALEARLMPRIEDDQGTVQQCKPQKLPHVEYPQDARFSGIQGMVVLEFALPADGRARTPRILYAMPAKVFDQNSREAILHMEFAARGSGEGALHCHLAFRYAEQDERASSYPHLLAFVETTRKQAEADDAGAEFLYGMLLAGIPQLGHSQKDALPWFLKAAQSGQREAQYQLGASLLFGEGCRCEETKAETWLRKAAEADEPNAQVTLAQFALRGTPDAASVRKAKLWLERAARSGNHDGMLELAALLATTPDADLRDPGRALDLLERVKKDLGSDPIEFEIRAGAQASSGDFSRAVDSEKQAVVRAGRLKWDLTPLQNRLDRYQTAQPWYGNLLAP
jgi:TonB family protein